VSVYRSGADIPVGDVNPATPIMRDLIRVITPQNVPE
jgi:hypothetical protein